MACRSYFTVEQNRLHAPYVSGLPSCPRLYRAAPHGHPRPALAIAEYPDRWYKRYLYGHPKVDDVQP